MKLLSKLCFLLSIMILFSCGDNETETLDPSIFGYEYFPLDIGYEWVYEVDSVLITQGGANRFVSNSFVRERVLELIDEDDDFRKYKLERSYRKDSVSDWRLTDIWTISIDKERAIRTEENLSFIKLVFPAVEGTNWDGNAFFDADALYPVGPERLTIYLGWEYRISDSGPVTINNIPVDDVIEVNHVDEEDFISFKFSQEKYAKDYGLVERHLEIYDARSGNADESQPWMQKAEIGMYVKQKLLSFSKN